jgi:hypothetical protein
MTTALERGEGSASRPGRFLPPGKTRYPLYRRLRGPQGRSGQVRKISPPTGIRSPDRPVRSQSLYRRSYRATYVLVSNCILHKVVLEYQFIYFINYRKHSGDSWPQNYCLRNYTNYCLRKYTNYCLRNYTNYCLRNYTNYCLRNYTNYCLRKYTNYCLRNYTNSV